MHEWEYLLSALWFVVKYLPYHSIYIDTEHLNRYSIFMELIIYLFNCHALFTFSICKGSVFCGPTVVYWKCFDFNDIVLACHIVKPYKLPLYGRAVMHYIPFCSVWRLLPLLFFAFRTSILWGWSRVCRFLVHIAFFADSWRADYCYTHFQRIDGKSVHFPSEFRHRSTHIPYTHTQWTARE